MTTKKKLTVRQAEQAAMALRKKITEQVDAFRRENPPPSWEDERLWEAHNLSPKRRWDREVNAIYMPLREKADRIELLANMEMVSAEELIKMVESFPFKTEEE